MERAGEAAASKASPATADWILASAQRLEPKRQAVPRPAAKVLLTRPLPPPRQEELVDVNEKDEETQYRARFRQGYLLSATGFVPERHSLIILGRPIQAQGSNEKRGGRALRVQKQNSNFNVLCLLVLLPFPRPSS